MGREIDQMQLEETGRRRLKTKKEPSAGPSEPESDPDYYDVDSLSLEALREIARLERVSGVAGELAMAILEDSNASMAAGERRWRIRHDNWARTILRAYEDEQGRAMTTRQPLQMLDIVWRTRNPQHEGESRRDYDTRAHWNSWRMYAQEIQILAETVHEEYLDLLRRMGLLEER